MPQYLLAGNGEKGGEGPLLVFACLPLHKGGFSRDSPQQVAQGKVKTGAFLSQHQREALQPRGKEGGRELLALSRTCLRLPSAQCHFSGHSPGMELTRSQKRTIILKLN